MNASADKKVASPCFILRRSLANSQTLVPDLLAEIREWMIKVGVGNDKNTDVQIVLAEALNNVIEHGFTHERTGTIEIDIEVSGDTTVVRLTDNGKAFTPPKATKSPMQNSCDIDNLPEGGFGWFLIKKIVSSYEFHRFSNKNLLVLEFL